MKRDEAVAILKEFTKTDGLLKHALAVEAAMKAYAHKYGQDEEKWGIVGLLHDFDYEIHPTADKHPVEGAKILRQRGVPEDIVHAILCHADHTGVARDSLMDKAIYAVDELTGLVSAVAWSGPARASWRWTPLRCARR